MLMQIFARGIGKGAGPVEYISSPLGLRFDVKGKIKRTADGKPMTYNRDPVPVILGGNPDQTIAIIDSLNFKFKYTSGVLSFAPEDGPLSEELEAQIIDDFERVAFAGLDKDQYACLWVRHAHQGHHELHFVIPRVVLDSGKSLNIAPPNYKAYFDPWRTLWNRKNQWADPDDPARAKLHRESAYKLKINASNLKDQIVDSNSAAEAITDYLSELCCSGLLNDRNDVVSALEDANLIIHRQGKDYLSIRTSENSKSIRLKGLIYEQNFSAERFFAATQRQSGNESSRNRGNDVGSIKRLEQDVAEAVERRAAFNRRRYPRKAVCNEPRCGTHNRSEFRSNPATEEIAQIGVAQSYNSFDKLLDRHLRCELGSDAILSQYDSATTAPERHAFSGNPFSNGSLGENRGKNLGINVQRISTGQISDHAGDRLRRNGLDYERWQASYKNHIKTLRGIYDGFRATTDQCLPQFIRTIDDAIRARIPLDRAIESATATIIEANRRVGYFLMKRDEELEAFKREINLIDYAMHCGYELVKEKSSAHSKVLSNSNSGDKIVVATNENGHGIYFSVTDHNSNGSIIDFIQNTSPGLSIGQVRQKLRPWLNCSQPVNINIKIPKPLPSSKDLQRVLVQYAGYKYGIPAYLTKNRMIDESILLDLRFHRAIKIDSYQNAVFPHYNENGLCGFEIKGENYTGFSKGGEKGLWCTSNLAQSRRIVICESAIDALSYADLHADQAENAMLSIGGSLSTNQLNLLNKIVGKAASRNAKIVVAIDNDSAGDTYYQQIVDIAKQYQISARLDRPIWHKDWNEQLIHGLTTQVVSQAALKTL